jgi:hypothetical protein
VVRRRTDVRRPSSEDHHDSGGHNGEQEDHQHQRPLGSAPMDIGTDAAIVAGTFTER